MLPIIRELAFEPHDLYHVSPKLYDFPCRTAINEAREWSQWHANGVLGLWASTFPAMCGKSFGAQTYHVEMKEGARRIGLPFGAFQKLTSDMEDFTDLIHFLCREGDVAYLVDGQPYVGEVIVLNFDQIARFTNVTGHDLKDVKVPMGAPR